MTLRDEIVAEARTWLKTPFHHQGRLKGVGVDCAGVPVGVAQALGLSYADVAGYARMPAKGQFRATIASVCISITRAEVLPGDLMSFAFRFEEQHIAFVSQLDPLRLIHAWEDIGKVVENDLDVIWSRRLRGCWRFKELT